MANTSSGFNPITGQEYYGSQPNGNFLPSGSGLSLQGLGQQYNNNGNSLGTWVNPPPSVYVDPNINQKTGLPTQDLLSTGLGAVKNGLNTPIFGSGGTIGSIIDDAGNFLGLSPGISPGTVGPAQGLSSAYTPGAALAGIGGGLAANLLGLSGEYSGITGSLGGIAGTAVGSSVGTILGFAGGPVGAALGSFVGSALGGLFGGKKPNPASVVGSNQGITALGEFKEGGTLASKHADTSFATKMRDTLNKFNSSIATQTNQDLSKTIKTLYSGYDVNHGPGFITFNSYFKKDHKDHNPDTSFYFDPNNAQSAETALRNYGSKLLQSTGGKYTGDQVTTIINNAIAAIAPKREGTTAVANVRPDIGINQKIPTGPSFDEFLKSYKEKYNANSSK